MYEPSRQDTRKQITTHAITGGFSLAGGIALSIVAGVAKIPFIGIAIGVGMALVGYRMLQGGAGRKKEVVQGSVLTAVGIVTAAAGLPIFGPLAGAVLGISSFGLIVYGGYKLYQYFRSSKNYS